jgi:hypothetical protein
MDDQIIMVFADVMDEAMSIAQAEEIVIAASSSSTQGSKRCRHYVKRDREAAHSDCGTTTSTMIVCIPILLPS